jgi:hypothetical protein
LPYHQHAERRAPVGDGYPEKAVKSPGAGLIDKPFVHFLRDVVETHGGGALGHHADEPLAEGELDLSDHAPGQPIRGRDHVPPSLVIREVNGANVCMYYLARSLHNDA